MIKKAIKSQFLHAARGAGLFKRARQSTSKAVRVLCYHGIWLGRRGFGGDTLFMRAETFAARMDLLKKLDYPIISLDQAVEALSGRAELPDSAVAITIDDGWYGTYAHMRPILNARSIPATLYCDTASIESGRPIPNVMAHYVHEVLGRPRLSDLARWHFDAAMDSAQTYDGRWAGLERFARELQFDLKPWIDERAFSYMTANELRTFAATPKLEVQLHTHNHTLGDMSSLNIREEIMTNAAALARMLDVNANQFRHFCYPSGLTTADAAQTLNTLGIASSTTTVNGLCYASSDLHHLPRILDGDVISEIEFEAEISGFLPVVRSGLHLPKYSATWPIWESAGSPVWAPLLSI